MSNLNVIQMYEKNSEMADSLILAVNEFEEGPPPQRNQIIFLFLHIFSPKSTTKGLVPPA